MIKILGEFRVFAGKYISTLQQIYFPQRRKVR